MLKHENLLAKFNSRTLNLEGLIFQKRNFKAKILHAKYTGLVILMLCLADQQTYSTLFAIF